MNKLRCAVIPGSFDPITTGHLDVIERAAAMFEAVYVTAFANADKKGGMFTEEEKLHMLQTSPTAQTMNTDLTISATTWQLARKTLFREVMPSQLSMKLTLFS